MKGKIAFSNIQHYLIPYQSGVISFMGNPSHTGVKINLEIAKMIPGHLNDVISYSKSVGVVFEIIMIFKQGPKIILNQSVNLLYENENIAIFRYYEPIVA
jgi:hypothetical protein